MALLFIDSFDAGDVALKWNLSGSVSTNATTRFGTGLSITSGFVSVASRLISASAQVTCGFAMRTNIVSTNGSGVALYGDNGATNHITVNREVTTGLLQIRRGGVSGTVLATGTTPLALNAWYFIEVQATIADAGGVVKVRLNGAGTDEVTYTGDTKNAGTNTTIDMVAFVNSNSTTVFFDDVYILNSTGSTNNTFLGDVRVHVLTPNGNGTYSQLTGSDADQVNNYQLVDELPYSSADYTGSATTGERDTYALANLPSGVTQVFGVQNNIIAAKSDATAASAKSALYTGGSLYYGATRVLSVSYLSYCDMFETNPNTTVARAAADVDSLESGMEVA
ncbi:hypothetical protein IPL85_05795 [Candidatus Saccharibacteria bacterium]|nr:MAG: hypothetical protein IPL85_05795 [Candidatus Saccharibacteria bacterium]